MIEHQRAGRDMRHHSIVGSELVIALSSYTRLSCGPVSAVGAARKNMDSAGDGAVVERDDTTVGDGAPADIGGEVWEGRMAVWIGLTVDVPEGMPALRIDVLQQSSLGYLLFVHGTVDG